MQPKKQKAGSGNTAPDMTGHYYPLFKFFQDEHEMVLLDSEIQDIIKAVENFRANEKQQELERMMEQLPEDLKESWKNLEPAPLEFFHGKMMDDFHEWRRALVGQSVLKVPMGGGELANLIVKSKNATYAKYPKQVSSKAIPKSEI